MNHSHVFRKSGFDVYDRSLELVAALREPLAVIARRDASLATQLRRAAASVALNLAESRARTGRDRQHLLRIALGSAREVQACLDVAAAFGYLAAADAARDFADRICAMLWRATH